jgi:hypothetical protein
MKYLDKMIEVTNYSKDLRDNILFIEKSFVCYSQRKFVNNWCLDRHIENQYKDILSITKLYNKNCNLKQTNSIGQTKL